MAHCRASALSVIHGAEEPPTERLVQVVAVVVLTPDEAAITRDGSLPEPSFRPFPMSFGAREPEISWDELLAVGADEVPAPSFEGPNSEMNSTEQLAGDADEVPDALTPPEISSALPGLELPRLGAAHRWKRSTRELALLVAEEGDGLYIIAIGSVAGGARTRARGVRNVNVRVRHVLTEPVSFATPSAMLTIREQELLRQMMRSGLRPLSPRLGQRLLEVLEQSNPVVGAGLAAARDELNAETAARASARGEGLTVLAREANSSALHIFRPAWHTLRPEPDPHPSQFAFEVEDLAGATENDAITDDAGAFPGWDRSEHTRGGWWEFRSAGRRLLVKNINVSPQENQTGADLVYVRREPDAFVLVQYKLLATLSNGRPLFRADGRLEAQVQRMLELENSPPGTFAADDLDTYRIGNGFSFAKFVLPSAAQTERPGELVPGYYLPSEFARRVLLAPDSGPNGGAVHYVAETGHLTSDMFARLVRDGWIGSTGDVTAFLRSVFNLRDTSDALVIAVDEPTGNPADPE